MMMGKYSLCLIHLEMYMKMIGTKPNQLSVAYVYNRCSDFAWSLVMHLQQKFDNTCSIIFLFI